MKVKKIKIQIKSLDEALDEFSSAIKKAQQGKKAKSKKATYVADPETARGIFTESRLKIIQIIKNQSPNSIYELAKILKRDFKNVYHDILFLTEVGILKIDRCTDQTDDQLVFWKDQANP
jgi:predicted transcriptional regulator